MKGRKMQKNNRKQEHNSIRPLIPYALIAYALILTGCAQKQHHVVIEQICLPDTQSVGLLTEKLQAMKIAEDVLGRMNFTIAKSDTEQGLIRTKPLPGAQSFEFWRSDNVGSFNSTEANLHSIRRIVELDISRQGGQLCINCDVKVQRLSMPEYQISSSGRAYEMFTSSRQSMQYLKLHPKQRKGLAWVDLGSDSQLATEILKRIEKYTKRQE